MEGRVEHRDARQVDVDVVEALVEEVADLLRDAHREHDREEEVDVVGDLKDDDREAHRHARDAAEHAGRADEGVQPGVARAVDVEHDELAGQPAERPAHEHARHKKPRRHRDAVDEDRGEQVGAKEGGARARAEVTAGAAREELLDRALLRLHQERRHVVERRPGVVVRAAAAAVALPRHDE